MLRISEVAKILGVSPQTIRAWIKNGVIKAIKPHGTYYISIKEVERLKVGDTNV